MSTVDWTTLAEAHSDEVWRAARRVVGNDDAAWDCVQDAFLTALATDRPPEGDPVPWLCGVARNHARHEIRARGRLRGAVERLGLWLSSRRRRATVADVTDLRSALAALPMRHRDAVVLRYLAGMTVPGVARAQGISEAAAKSRVRRGLARLRRILAPALLVLLLVRERVTAAPALASGSAALRTWRAPEVSPSRSPVLPWAAAGVLVLAALLLVSESNGRANPPPNPEPEDPVAAAPGEEAGTANGGKRSRVPMRNGLPLYPADRALAELAGYVVDEYDTPIPGATVRVRSDLGGWYPGLEIADDREIDETVVTDRDGRFRRPDLPVGPYRITASAATDEGPIRAVRSLPLCLDPLGDPLRLVLKSPSPRRDFVVDVVDEAGLPVPDARVETVGSSPPLAGATDAEGTCEFPGRRPRACLVTAICADGRRGRVRYFRQHGEDPASRMRVVVHRPGGIEGRLTGVEPDRADGCRVRLHSLTSQSAYHWTYGTFVETDVREGRFAFSGLSADDYGLTLESVNGLRLVLPLMKGWNGGFENSVSPARVEVRAGEVAPCALEVTEGGTLAGRVATSDGKPVGDATVICVYAPENSNITDGNRHDGVHVWRLDSDSRRDSWHPETHRRARTGPDGRYELRGMHPGRHRVEVLATGLTWDRRMDVAVADGKRTDLEHVLGRAGAMQGTIGRSMRILVSPVEGEGPRIVAWAHTSGNFTIAGLAPGEYRVETTAKGGGDLLGRVEIAAGRTTWADLRIRGGGYEVRALVRDDQGPVAGATVYVPALERSFRTDGEGRVSYLLLTRSWEHGHHRVVCDGTPLAISANPTPVGESACSVELPIGTHTLRLRTVDAAGSAVPTAFDLRIQDAFRLPSGQFVRMHLAARTGPDGFREIPRLHAGKYLVSARFPDGSRTDDVFDVPREEPLVVAAPAAGRIVVAATDPRGRPLVGARVHCIAGRRGGPPVYPRPGYPKATTGRTGEVLLCGVPAGEVRVVLTAGHPWRPTASETRKITLKPGERKRLEFRRIGE